MFVEAFIHLNAVNSEFIHFNQIVSLSDCLEVHKTSEQEASLARRSYLGLRYNAHSDPAAVQQALETLNQKNRFIQFLNACLEILQSSKTQSMATLIFQVSLLKPDLQLNIEHFFSSWISYSAQEAIQYYEDYNETLLGQVSTNSLEASTVLLLGKRVVEHELAKLRIALKHQNQPLAVCRLVEELLPIPTRLAASVLWMVEQKIELKAVLNTGLLHRFFAYHMNSLAVGERHDVLNSVALLYGLFEQFDSIKPLVLLARQQACHVRGHERYNLLGEQAESLQTTKIDEQFPLLTKTPENLFGMVSYFDQKAFNEIVHTLFSGSDNDDFDRCVISFTKARPHLVSPRIIKHIAQERDHELAKWVCFVDEQLFQEWLDKGELAMLYLLSHKPKWMHRVDATLLQRFFNLIFEVQQPGAEHEVMHLLMCLYNVASAANLSLASSIYVSMIDVILTHRHLFEDKQVYRHLKRSYYKDECIEAKATMLMTDLAQKAADFFSEPLSYSKFASLKSDWLQLYNQIEILQQLKKLKCHFPQTEVDLIVYLFQMHARTPSPDWQQLINMLELNAISADEVSTYNQRALFKIFSQVDSACVRDMIVDLYRWDQSDFRSELADKAQGPYRHLLLDAISAGNKCVLEWYLQTEHLDDELLLKAIALHQWEWIEHWFVNYELPMLSQHVLDTLLVAVAGLSNFRFLRQLLDEWSFESSVIAQAFANASRHNDVKALYLLYLSSPAKPILKVAFNEAVKNRHFESIAFFGGIKNRKEELANEVIRAFNKAVKDNDLALVDFLCQFVGNAPSITVVKLAMEKASACQQKEMTDCLRQILLRFQEKKEIAEFTRRKDNRKEHTFFRSTQSLTHLSIYDSPVSPEP